MPHPRATRPPDPPSLTSLVAHPRQPLQTPSIEPDLTGTHEEVDAGVYTIGAGEQPYRLIVEVMSEGAVILGSRGRIAYANRSFAAMVGLALDRVTGSDMTRFVIPEDLASFNELLLQAHAGDGHGEIRLSTEGGVTVPVQLSIRAVESGTSGNLCVVITNLTDGRGRDEAERLELIRRLMDVAESERRRVARELHDQFGQQLSALTLKLATLGRNRGRRTQLSEQLEPLERIAKQLGADLDLLVSRLRPPALDDLGLMAALDQYVRRWSEEFGVRAELHAQGIEAGGLSSETETALYRIVQEALNNVVKHSQARYVAILLTQAADRVSLIIEDDGIGFDAEQRFHARRFGVTGMRERTALLAGTFDIESSPGRGTTVAVRIPLARAEGAEA